MNARTLELLKLLSSNQPYTIRDLSNEFDVSERFIRYMIDDCDYYLKSINLPSIIFTNDGVTLQLSETQEKDLLRQINNIDLFSYDVSAKERQSYIILSLLCCNKPIKTSFFSELLNVSKSSIEKDLTFIKQKLEENNLEIKNVLGKGIYLDGNEINVRRELLHLISKNFDFSKLISDKSLEMHSFIERNIYSFLFEIYINKVFKIVDDVEENAKLKLSFLSYKDLCVYIIVMINRLSLGKKIELFENQINQVKEMRTYKEADDLCNKISDTFNIDISSNERAYLCLILESSHFTTSSEIAVKEWAIVQMYSNKLIDAVSNKLCIDLTNDKELVNSLTLHIGLSFFKIQNNVPILNEDVENIKKMYPLVFSCIKSFINTSDSGIINDVFDDDIAYLTLHIQAAIERNKKEERQFNILVVCIHGYGTASLMKELIISRYKNIVIKKIVTSNSIENENLDGIDFIVSSVDLNEKRCPVIKVDTILKKHDYLAIEDMMKKLGNYPSYKNNDSIDDILSIISENSHINDFEKLKNEIENYLNIIGISKIIKH